MGTALGGSAVFRASCCRCTCGAHCIAALQLHPKTSCPSSTPCIAALQALAEIVKACVQESAKTRVATQAAADRIASAVREQCPQEGDDLQAALEMDQEPADIEDIRQYFDKHHMDKNQAEQGVAQPGGGRVMTWWCGAVGDLVGAPLKGSAAWLRPGVVQARALLSSRWTGSSHRRCILPSR